MRIDHGQCLFRMLACQVFLPNPPIGVGKVIIRVGRVRIGEQPGQTVRRSRMESGLASRSTRNDGSPCCVSAPSPMELFDQG
jgi:hypothetical protein